MTAGSRDDCKATQIKCYNGTSSNGLGKTRRAMKTGESYPGKAVLQYALHRYKVSPGRQNIFKNPDPSGSGVNEPLINFIRSKQFLH